MGSIGWVRRLDLALLVDAQHQRARGEIEANNVPHLVDEQRVARQLESLDPVWLQAKRAPDAMDRRRRDATRP